MKFLILYLILLAFLGACKGNQQNINTLSKGETPEAAAKKIRITIDSFVIPNTVFDSTDITFWQTQDIGDSSYSFVCNRNTKRFEVYNLTEPQLTWSLSYVSEDFPSVREACFHNLDTVFILSEDGIVGLNKKGIFFKKEINKIGLKQNFLPYTLFSYNMRSVWSAEKKGFFMQGFCSDCDKDKNTTPFFSTPIEVFVPIDSSLAWDTLQAIHPPRYRTKCNHAWLWEVQRAINKNTHIYSFSAESDLYVYDVVNKTYIAKPARSQYDTVDFICMNDLPKKKQTSDGRLQHFILSPTYNGILYDPYRELYYRFFYPALPEKNDNGFYNDLESKDAVLMVFDKDFKLLTEWLLPKGQFLPFTASIGKKGLYILNAIPKPYSFDYAQKISIINFIVE